MDQDLPRYLGACVRRDRLALGWTQRRLGAEAGVSQHAVACAEAGEGASLGVIERVFRALGSRVSVSPPPVFGVDQSDIAHRWMVRAIRRQCERVGHEVATEQPIIDGRLRGWIDLLSFDRRRGRLGVVEVKTELLDLGGLERQVERYARAAMQPARLIGWHPKEILVAVVALGTRDADAFVSSNRDELAVALPMRGQSAAKALLDGGPVTGRALLALDPSRPGRLAFTSFRVDGRRRSFELVHASDLRRAIEERAALRDRRQGSVSGGVAALRH